MSPSKGSAIEPGTQLEQQPGQIDPPPLLRQLAASAGVVFNGKRPWDIQVHDRGLYQRIMRQGTLGFGEAYTEGAWDSHQLDETFYRLLSADLNSKIHGVARLRFLTDYMVGLIFNRQSRRRAYEVARRHYDIGNDVYRAMLDSTMCYSCGHWQHANNLEQAQQDKLRLICDKLQLQAGESLLDIGCGWGALAHFAATHYGVQVWGITVSEEQAKLAQKRCQGLPVTIELMDYRELDVRYDKIVSVGMFEHVGPKNYRTFFHKVSELLRPEGLFLLHTIGNLFTDRSTDPWIDRYIFPNYAIPSARQLTTAMESSFVLEDWHNFGPDYDRTLMAWWANFDAAWPALKAKYGHRFYRIWKYYLHSCAGFFRSRQGQLWQLVLSKRARQAIYRSIR